MPMFSSEIGSLVADLAARRAARQEDNADARARQTLLSYIQDPIYAQAANEAANQDQQDTGATAPLLTTQAATPEFGFTPAPGATVTPMLTGLQPIVQNPRDASQGFLNSQSGVSVSGRNRAESILFPMLTEKENRDLRWKQAELDQLVRARPGLVSRMYAGEAGAKPIDDRIRELQSEIEKGQQANERLKSTQMLTGQKLISSYSNKESQDARLKAAKELQESRARTQTAIAQGKLDLEHLKLAVNSSLKATDQVLKRYGIDKAYLSSQGGMMRAIQTGTLDDELKQAGMDAATVDRAMGGIRRAVASLQSTDPKDWERAAEGLMDPSMDFERVLSGDVVTPTTFAEAAAEYNARVPEWMQINGVITQAQADEMNAARAASHVAATKKIGALKPGEAPPKFFQGPGGEWYIRYTESGGSGGGAKKPSRIPSAAPAGSSLVPDPKPSSVKKTRRKATAADF